MSFISPCGQKSLVAPGLGSSHTWPSRGRLPGTGRLLRKSHEWWLQGEPGKGGERASEGTSRAQEDVWNLRARSSSRGAGQGLGRRRCGEAPGEGPGAHLVQHGIAFGPLSLPKQHQASNDVRWHNVQVPEKFSKEVGDFRVGIL